MNRTTCSQTSSETFACWTPPRTPTGRMSQRRLRLLGYSLGRRPPSPAPPRALLLLDQEGKSSPSPRLQSRPRKRARQSSSKKSGSKVKLVASTATARPAPSGGSQASSSLRESLIAGRRETTGSRGSGMGGIAASISRNSPVRYRGLTMKPRVVRSNHGRLPGGFASWTCWWRLGAPRRARLARLFRQSRRPRREQCTQAERLETLVNTIKGRRQLGGSARNHSVLVEIGRLPGVVPRDVETTRSVSNPAVRSSATRSYASIARSRISSSGEAPARSARNASASEPSGSAAHTKN